jgi:hypothetical protein
MIKTNNQSMSADYCAARGNRLTVFLFGVFSVFSGKNGLGLFRGRKCIGFSLHHLCGKKRITDIGLQYRKKMVNYY